MTTTDIIDIVNKSLREFGKFSLDVLSLSKPSNTEEAINLCKIVSKLSPIVGNLIEYRMVDFFNSIPEFQNIGVWRRQDPGFPDTVFDSKILPQPGIEVKAWFPLATEMTARFRESRKFFAQNQTYVLIVCWIPEFIIFGKPIAIGTSFISAKSIAEVRDTHYFNPPDYLVLEPENTDSRTKNLRQSNTNGYKFQDTKEAFKEAEKLVNQNRLNEIYTSEDSFQTSIRKLFGQFKYRLDTNFAKIDRIQHPAIEEFKQSIMHTQIHGLPIQAWRKIILQPRKDNHRYLIQKKLGIQ